jgi:predicted metal-binding membrane protein
VVGLTPRSAPAGVTTAALDAAVVALARRDRRLVLAGLAGSAALAWLYLAWDAASMASVAPADEGLLPAPGHTGLTFLMWAVMMVGMMLPSAAPTVLAYASLARRTRERGGPFPGVWVLAVGYLAIWTTFSALATALQVALEWAALLSPMAEAEGRPLVGALLLAAGSWQWLPVKAACLRHCRAPFQFFLTRWRPGARGAFVMGLEHGLFCLGCCWALMLLLFVGGVMDLVWVALIAGFVLVEKLAPFGPATGRVAGVLLGVLGLWTLLGLPLP